MAGLRPEAVPRVVGTGVVPAAALLGRCARSAVAINQILTRAAPPSGPPAAGELPASSTMVPVLARLLEFSPSELRRVQEKAAAQTSSASSSLFSFPSVKLPGLGG